MSPFIWLVVVGVLLVGCSTGDPEGGVAPATPPVMHSPSYDTLDMAAGQTVYVPVYSHAYQDKNKRPFNLITTLSIRNTDLEHSIQVVSVRYYSSQGKLMRNFVEQPQTVAPLASIDFVADEHDDDGSGTCFIVEWVAAVEVHEPVIEGVMISTVLSQGLSFTSPGRVIRSLHK